MKAVLAFTIAFVFFHSTTMAQSNAANSPGRLLQMSEVVYAETTSMPADAHAVLSMPFRSIPNDPFNGGIVSKQYWFRFSVANNDGSAQHAFIDIQNPKLNHLELLEIQNDSLKSLGKYGDFFDFSQRRYLYKNFLFRSNLQAGTSKHFLLHVNQVGHSFTLPIKLFTEKNIQITYSNDYLFEGLTMGVLLFVALLSLLFFVNTKDRIYLYYSLYTLSAVGWVLSYFGLGFQHLWPNYPYLNTANPSFFAGFNLLLNIQLCQILLRVKRNSFLNRYSNGVKALLAVLSVFPYFINLNKQPPIFNQVHLYAFLFTVILAVGVIVYSLCINLRKLIPAKYYFFASTVKVAGILNLALLELGISPALYNLQLLLQGGIIFEVIFLSYAIAKRTQVMRMKLKQQHEANNEMRISFQKELLKAQLEIQEQTFKSISQEIHDNIGQMLTLLRLNLNNLQQQHEGVTEELEDAKNILKKVMQDLRDLSKTMNSEMITKTGLAKAIETELHTINRATGMQTLFNWQATPPMDPQVELILFRLVQESLHNIIKHAKATTIEVNAAVVGAMFQLIVRDDGMGCDFHNTTSNGSGLLNIQSRCKLIHATVEFISSPGMGACVKITLPIADAAPCYSDEFYTSMEAVAN